MNPHEIAQTIVQRLEDAWNAGDGAAYGAPFAADADFVAIRGDWHSGEQIGAGHQQIFETIYAGSMVRYEVLQARPLDANVIVAHIRGCLSTPTGPLAGDSEALATMVIATEEDEPRIAAFHNTLVASPGS